MPGMSLTESNEPAAHGKGPQSSAVERAMPPGSAECVEMGHRCGGLWPWGPPAVVFLFHLQCTGQTNREINHPETRD